MVVVTQNTLMSDLQSKNLYAGGEVNQDETHSEDEARRNGRSIQNYLQDSDRRLIAGIRSDGDATEYEL